MQINRKNEASWLMTKLSIIIPIYNTEIAKLQRCLESIKLIRTKSYECILVDDGSAEETGAYLKDYANITSGFRYIRKENGGVSSARNLGMEKARGEYICFVDADDEIEPDAYNSFLLEENKSDVVFSDLALVVGDKRELCKPCEAGKITYEEMIRRILTDERINGPYCKYIKREYLNKHGIYFREEMYAGEDLVFLLDILLDNPSMSYISKVSYYYYREETSNTNRLKKYFTKLYFNYREAYIKEGICISNGNFNPDMVEYLEQRSIEKYIKAVFNTTLDLTEMDIDLFDVEHDLEQVVDPVDTKKASQMTKLRKRLMLKKRWHLLKMIAFIRRKYLKIKGNV